MSKINRWIVGLMILALLTVGGVALAGGGFSLRNGGSRAVCSEAGDSAVCTVDDDGDGIVNSEDSDWTCPEDGSGCDENAGACLRISANRTLDSSGARCVGVGQDQRIGGCRGGRF